MAATHPRCRVTIFAACCVCACAPTAECAMSGSGSYFIFIVRLTLHSLACVLRMCARERGCLPACTRMQVCVHWAPRGVPFHMWSPTPWGTCQSPFLCGVAGHPVLHPLGRVREGAPVRAGTHWCGAGSGRTSATSGGRYVQWRLLESCDDAAATLPDLLRRDGAAPCRTEVADDAHTTNNNSARITASTSVGAH